VNKAARHARLSGVSKVIRRHGHSIARKRVQNYQSQVETTFKVKYLKLDESMWAPDSIYSEQVAVVKACSQ